MLGNILFVAAFIVLPLTILIWSLLALRTMGKRQPRVPEYLTTEPEYVPAHPATTVVDEGVRSLRVPATTMAPTAEGGVVLPPSRRYHPPIYRGRAGGVVRRMTANASKYFLDDDTTYVVGPASQAVNDRQALPTPGDD